MHNCTMCSFECSCFFSIFVSVCFVTLQRRKKVKTDVTPAILSSDFVALLYRAIKSRTRATKSREKIAGVTSVLDYAGLIATFT